MVPDHNPSSKRLSRRRALVSAVAVSTVGLAGCSGAASSDVADCTTTALAHGDGDVLQQATATTNDESVVLFVSLQEPGDALPIESVLVRDSEGNLRDEVPITDAREYRHTIGSSPHHGHLNLLAVNDQRMEIDSMEIEYQCTGN